MKSVVITILLFAAVMCAIHFGVFELMASPTLYYIGLAVLIIVFAIAWKILGNPFQNKDKQDEKK
ncbi:MAG: hypothetical protein IJ870_01625 [Alphaproteobacteria bacterium]|nr:hypothetical protein [Alphaproteobacteria bacterium]